MGTTIFTSGVTLSQAAWAQDTDTIVYNYLLSVAGTNTITGTGPKGISAYAAGMRFRLLPANTNTGATTLEVSSNGISLGVKNIFCNGAACVGGEIRQNIPAEVEYDGTQFQIIAPFVGGNLPNGQIKFPATQNASSDANTFDDYEEGIWTPGISFNNGTTGITYSSQVGTYTKIGQMIVYRFSIALSSKGSSTGVARITGFPFTFNASHRAAIEWTQMTSSLVWMSINGGSGGTTADINGLTAAATGMSNLTDTAFGNNSNLNGVLVCVS